MEKQELRALIRQQKQHFSPEELRQLSVPIIDRLLENPKVRQSHVILLYHSLPDEVYTHSLLDILAAEGKNVLLPVVIGDGMMTTQIYRGNFLLHEGAFHIMEPQATLNDTDGKEPSISPDVAIIPGMVFDLQGNRIGRGKGYYDRYLQQLYKQGIRPYTIGLCFPFQIVDHIPTETHDVPVDEVIS